MCIKNVNLSEIGKIVTAVALGVAGGGIGSKAIESRPDNIYELPESSATLINRIAERQMEFSNKITRLETNSDYILRELETLKSRIVYNVAMKD